MTKNVNGGSEEFLYIPMNDPSLVFTTYDIGLSSALLCLGFKLQDVDKENPRKALFIFKKEGGIEDFANQYFNDELGVHARSFFDHLKALKNKLYS